MHNPQNSRSKTDTYNNMIRIMEWEYDKTLKIEKSNITFEIDNKRFSDTHTFRIFTIDEIKECCEHVGLNVISIYENYDIKEEGKMTSKNLQFLITSNS